MLRSLVLAQGGKGAEKLQRGYTQCHDKQGHPNTLVDPMPRRQTSERRTFPPATSKRHPPTGHRQARVAHRGDDQYDRAAHVTKLLEQWWKNGLTSMDQITGADGSPLQRNTLHPYTVPSKAGFEEVISALWPQREAQLRRIASTSKHTLTQFLHPSTTPYDLTPCHLTNHPVTVECQEDEYQAKCIRGEKYMNETTY
jgi:hypothetical protein